MRCPECVQRNSVAARKCQFCGAKFPKKKQSLPFKVIAAVILVGFLAIAAFSILPKLTQPNQDLKNIAGSITSGPESAEQAQKLKNKLDKAILAFLKKNGSLSSGDLLTTLQAQLPTSIFEVLVFDLPRKIKLVEVDCVLQPADFLILESDKGPKVTQLFGLDVFDEGRLIKTEADPYLILIGHTNVDMKKKPNLKAVALLPNGNSVDQSNKLIPAIKGEGSINFDKNNRDIVLERKLVQTAKAEELFKGELKFEDKPFKTVLKWKNGKYEPEHDLGHGKFSALYAVASVLTEPGEMDGFKSYLNDPARKFIQELAENPVVDPPGFTIAKIDEKQTTTRRSRRRSRRASSSRSQIKYALASGKRSFEVILAGADGQRWTIADIDETTPESTLEQMAEDTSGNPESKAEVVKANELEKKQAAEREAAALKKREDADKLARLKKEESERQARQDKEDAARAKKAAASKDEAAKKAALERAREEAAKKIAAEKAKQEAAKKLAAKPSQVSSTTPAAGGKSIVTHRGVTVRSGPGTKHGRVTTARKGDTVKVIGKDNGWYKVVVNGKQGYVWSGLIDYKKSDGYTTAVVRKKKPVQDSNRKIVSTANPGDKVVVVGGLRNNRYKVRTANGKIGYVEKDAIDVAVEEPAFVP